jgi:hypothetical protein
MPRVRRGMGGGSTSAVHGPGLGAEAPRGVFEEAESSTVADRGGMNLATLPPEPPQPAPTLAVVGEPGSDGARRYGTLVSELLAIELDPPKWIIPGYLQEENIAILAGPPGAGKTLQAFDWCAKLVQSGKTVFIAENEGGLPAFQSRLRRSCTAAGIPVPPDRYSYERNLQLDLANFKQVKNFAKALEYTDLILLDSLAAFWPGLDENKPEHMGVVAEALKILCEISRAAILGIHHTTKAAWKPGERPSLADLRGHGTMAGRIDAAYIVKPMQCPGGLVRYELHVVKQRDGAWAQPQAVEVLMTGDAATVTMEPLQPGPRGLSMAKQSGSRDREIEQQVLLQLPEEEEKAISLNEICGLVRKAKPDVTQAVKTLYHMGRIQQDYKGRYYRVKASPSDPGNSRLNNPSWNRPYQPPGEGDYP